MQMGGAFQSKCLLYAKDDYSSPPLPIFLSLAKNVLQNYEAQKAGILVV